jgi:hypothetical protein
MSGVAVARRVSVGVGVRTWGVGDGVRVAVGGAVTVATGGSARDTGIGVA